MKWYADYLSIYDKPFTQAPQAVINQVKDKIRQLATHAPLVSVVAIAHNEEKRILSCLWSLCENIIRKSKFPQNPKRSVRFSGKRTKRSVQKRKARNTQKAETKVL